LIIPVREDVMIARLAFLAALLCATPVAAQIALPNVQGPEATAQEVAAARAQADQIIATANAQAYFTNVTSDRTPAVKHDASGMVCRFEPGSTRNSIRIYAPRPNAPVQGEDVSCGTSVGDGGFTIYATRYKPLPSEADDMREAVRQMQATYGELKPYEGTIGLAQNDDVSIGQTLTVQFQFEGRPYASLTQIAHRDGWAFKLRASGPPEEMQATALYGSMSFLGMLTARDVSPTD
jgi:hypothetical protein